MPSHVKLIPEGFGTVSVYLVVPNTVEEGVDIGQRVEKLTCKAAHSSGQIAIGGGLKELESVGVGGFRNKLHRIPGCAHVDLGFRAYQDKAHMRIKGCNEVIADHVHRCSGKLQSPGTC